MEQTKKFYLYTPTREHSATRESFLKKENSGAQEGKQPYHFLLQAAGQDARAVGGQEQHVGPFHAAQSAAVFQQQSGLPRHRVHRSHFASEVVELRLQAPG